MNELVKVNFYGQQIDAIKNKDGVWVSLKRMCENIGVAYSAQLQKLRGKSWACVLMINTHDTTGRIQELVTLGMDSVPMWLATIDSDRVAPELKERLDLYQKECARVLRNHFFAAPDLQIKLAAYIGERLAAWSMMFPREFWQGLDRLYQVKREDQSKRPLFYARCVTLVYETMDPDVYRAMKERVPAPQTSGIKQHQSLSPFGREETSRHVWRCVGMMDSCTSGPEWTAVVKQAFSKQGRLPLKGVQRIGA